MIDWDFVIGFSSLLVLVTTAFFTTTKTGYAIWCWFKERANRFWAHLKELHRWLKGSRTSYWLDNGTARILDYDAWSRASLHVLPSSIIQIGRGPFGSRRSKVFDRCPGPWGPPSWWITEDWKAGDVDYVRLASNWDNFTVTDALRLVNTYSSLQAMLNRIAELERELESSNKRRQEWGAGIKAVLQIIQLDRPRYRSKAAWHIRQCLELIEGQAVSLGEPEPTEKMISWWKDVFTNADLQG